MNPIAENILKSKQTKIEFDDIPTLSDAPPVASVTTYKAGTLNGVPVDVQASPDAPAIDRNYIWSPESARIVRAAEIQFESRKAYIWLTGIHGSGKSALVQQYAARTKRPFFRIAFHRDTAYEDLIGSPELRGDETTWEPKPFVIACRTPYAVIVLEEFPVASAGVTASTNTVMDGVGTTLPDGTTLTVHETVNIFAAANHNGSGDESGEYVATSQVDASTVDRFDFTFKVDYADPTTEATMLVNRIGVSADTATKIVTYASITREACERGEIASPMSMRRTLAWAKLIHAGFDPYEALDVAWLSRLRSDELETVKKFTEASFPFARPQ